MSRPAIQQAPRQPNGAKPMDARALNKLSMPELTKLAINYNIEDISGLRKQELIGRIVAVQAKQNGSVYGGGVLEILPDGFGFLRSEENNYLASANGFYEFIVRVYVFFHFIVFLSKSYSLFYHKLRGLGKVFFPPAHAKKRLLPFV